MVATLDAISNTACHSVNDATTGLTYSHTCDAAATQLTVKVAFSDADAGVTAGVTYDGVAMTSMGAPVHGGGSTYGFLQYFQMTNPPSGAHNVVVTTPGASSFNRILSVAMSWLDADVPTGLTSNTGTGTAISLNMNVASGEVGVMGASSEYSINTTESHNELAALNNTNFSGNANLKVQDTTTSGTPVAFTLTCSSSGLWVAVGFVIPALAPPVVNGRIQLEDGSGNYLLENNDSLVSEDFAGSGAGDLIVNAGDAAADGASVTMSGGAVFSVSAGDASADGGSASFTGAAALAVTAGDASADGASTSFTGAGVFAVAAGDATAAGDSASFGAPGDFVVSAGDATADGGSATFVGLQAATFTVSAGDASADGGSVAFLAGAVFSTAAGDASADGGSASLVGAALFAVTAGNASGDGGSATFVGAGAFTVNAGDALAEGSSSVTFNGAGAATMFVISGDAAADGGSASFIGLQTGTFTVNGGNASADGGLASLVGASLATFSVLAGSASADGASVAFTGAATFLPVVGDALGDGGSVAFIGEAVFSALAGNADAAGDLVAFLTAIHVLASGAQLMRAEPHRAMLVPAPPAVLRTAANNAMLVPRTSETMEV